MTTRKASHWFGIVMLATITACGGGGGGGSDADTTAPTGSITSPPEGGVTDSDMIVVRGIASDNVAVASVNVSGSPAISTNGFATWETILPLSVGENLLNLEVVDTSGNINVIADSVTVTREAMSSNPIPMADIDFPPADGLYADDATVITLRGSATDADGVAAVTVNGIDASSSDDFATWTVSVPLADGENNYVVYVEDSLGGFDAMADTRTIKADFGPYLEAPTDMVSDTANGVIYISDSLADAIFAFDTATGALEILANINNPVGMALSSGGSFLLVASSAGLQSVDTGTGSITPISNDTLGTGPSFGTSLAIAFDGSRIAYVLGGDTGATVYEVELTTGNRTEFISDLSEGEVFTVFPGIAVSRIEGILYVGLTNGGCTVAAYSTDDGTKLTDQVLGSCSGFSDLDDSGLSDKVEVAVYGLSLLTGAVYEVGPLEYGMGTDPVGMFTTEILSENNEIFSAFYSGLVSGDQFRGAYAIFNGVLPKIYELTSTGLSQEQTLLSADTAGDGANLVNGFKQLTVDWSELNAYSLDFFNAVKIDLTNGQRSFFGPNGGDLDFKGLGLDGANDQLLVPLLTGALSSIDLMTEVATELSGLGQAPPSLTDMSAITVDAVRGQAVVSNFGASLGGDEVIASVDLVTGARNVIASDMVGSGVPFVIANDVEMDVTNDQILAATGASGLYSIDPDTGVRTVIASAAVGSGASIGTYDYVAVDEVNNRALVADNLNANLQWVDLATGNRTIVSASDNSVGSGPAFSSPAPSGLIYDSDSQFAVISVNDGLIIVDTVTGARAYVTR